MTRNFTDRAGVEWTVWQVTPGSALLGAVDWRRKRSGEDRRVVNAVGFDPALDRRSGRDRRLTIAGPLQRGWLAFLASTGARRRLAPVPPAWQDATEAELDELCRAAMLARPASR
ncbi:MAG: hypothetical protein ACJ79S_21825 [Gemmatimonadaceae bacterium]